MTPTTLNLTGVEVLQDAVKTDGAGSEKGVESDRGGEVTERGGRGGVREVHIHDMEIIVGGRREKRGGVMRMGGVRVRSGAGLTWQSWPRSGR